MKKLFLLSLIFISLTAYSQSNKPTSISFEVGGTCGMCKARIEKTVDVKGVKYAEYTLSNHNLDITYVPSKISEDQIHKLLNDAGHDTEKSIASDEAYDKIHSCCKYRKHDHDHEHNEDHER